MLKPGSRVWLKEKLYKYPWIKHQVEWGVFCVPLSLKIINFIFQRVFRVNGKAPWPVNFTSRVTRPEKISLGEGATRSFQNSGGCYIQGNNGIYIGAYTLFSPGVKIISANHNIAGKELGWIRTNPIRIGSHCWLGSNSVILPGVEIGDNVVVGAGSVVTKRFGSNLVIAGNPAKIVKGIEKEKLCG